MKDCREVRKRVEAAGALVGGTGTVGTRAGPEVLRLLVGRWTEVKADPTAARIEQGPKVSGVFARPSKDGKPIALLDSRGRTVRTLGAGAGLVAATQFLDQKPTWVVTGTDAVGVAVGGGGAGGVAAEGPLRGRGREGPGGADPAAGRHDGGAVTYRRRSSPAPRRAGRGRLACTAWCSPRVALSFEHPLILAALLLAVMLAAAGAQVLGPVARSLLWGLPFALVIAGVNALVVRDGLTVIARFGELPPLGQIDVTLEATAYGGVLACAR